MSRVTRRKHVLKEMMEDDFELPKEHQRIVRVVSSRGNNLHEVETDEPAEEKFLVSMPNKFRKNFWVKRGNYILVEPIEEGDKVKAEICKILTPEHVKEYTKAGVWPKQFTKKRARDEQPDSEGDDADSLSVRNLNRPPAQNIEESDDEDDDDDDDDDDVSTSDEEN